MERFHQERSYLVRFSGKRSVPDGGLTCSVGFVILIAWDALPGRAGHMKAGRRRRV